MAISVTYNSYALPNVSDKYFFSESYGELTFRCAFFLRENSSSALMTEEATAIAAIREPFERLQVSFNSSSEFDIDHDSNTALNPYATIKKSQGPRNTEVSREYEFEYRCKLPADKSGFDFRQDSSFSIDTNDARRRVVSFSLTYTAGGANSSRTNFDTFAEPFCNGILSAIGGNYEKLSENSNTDDQDKFTTGKFVFQEILEDDLDGTTNDTSLTNISTDYSVDFGQSIGLSITGSYVASPQNRINITYKVKANKEVLATTAVAALYNSSVKPYIISNAFTRLDLGTDANTGDFFIVENDTYNFNPNDYTFSGRLTLMAPQNRNAIISLKETLTNDIDDGILATKVWDQQAHTYALYHMGTTERLTRVTEIIQIGTEPEEPERLTQVEGANFIRQKISRRKHVEKQGIGDLLIIAAEAEVHDVFFVSFSESYLRVDSVANQAAIEGPGEEIVGGIG